MNNEELISTLHDKAQALNFETRWLIFEALKRLEVLTETTKWIKSPSGEWICEKCHTTCCYEDKDGKTRPDKMGIRYCPRCGRLISK